MLCEIALRANSGSQIVGEINHYYIYINISICGIQKINKLHKNKSCLKKWLLTQARSNSIQNIKMTKYWNDIILTQKIEYPIV